MPKVRPPVDARQIQASDTAVDEMDLIADLPDSGRAEPAVDDKTPVSGVPGVTDEEDILEPREERAKIVEALEPGATLEFRGSGFGLMARQIPQALFGAAGVAGIGLGAALIVVSGTVPAASSAVPADVLDQVKTGLAELPPKLASLPHLPWIALGAGAVLCLLSLYWWRTAKWYRLQNTWAFGDQVSVQAGPVSAAIFGIANLVLFAATAGLVTPWIVAWNRKRLYQSSEVVARRRAKKLDFTGTGGQALGLLLLTGLTGLFAPLTLGAWGAVLVHKWVKWEHGHALFPSPTGKGSVEASFHGTWTQLWPKLIVGGVLSSLTAGLYLPFATVSVWRWAAEHTTLTVQEKASRRERAKKR